MNALQERFLRPKRKHRKLSPARKAQAKRMAKRAGRRYPNMVDNVRAARK